MRTTQARLLVGATLLVAGFGVMTDGAPLRLLDFKERECKTASVAIGSACPAGCEARPIGAPEDRSRPTECHSPLWIATCGTACEPEEGYVRLPDGRLADARRLVIALSGQPTSVFERELSKLLVTAEPRFDGMYRYEVVLHDNEDSAGLEEMKKRLAALPGIVSVDHLFR